ncbi:prefoldin subunit 2 [Fopius arisanus]|uniref:Prefoldin subunit 2 n=1 Tax=Fopius arisanus TaxID=64838 RepID=A0A9R1T4V8_9HYME|nr:PREDICTED: prefoldin subunit 2 [Fopius arisanus]
MASDKKMGKPLTKGGKSNEEILAAFQTLRNDQRLMASKLSEMEMELNEHKIVIDTLKTVDPKRKCYRMIGGVLCEQVVVEVLPNLITNKKQLTKVIASLHEQLTRKGTEINEFKEKHNIRIRGIDELQRSEDDSKEPKESKRNALVVNSLEA